MLPTEQLSLISPEDSALERLHRDVRYVSETVSVILDSLPIQRRPLAEWTKALHVRVTQLRRNGFCPCCQQMTVCNSQGRLEGAEFDHWYARYRNGAEETWLVCAPCNRSLEVTSYKAAVRSAFEAYQLALRPFLSGQRTLFPAT
jgi:hypothetical protein